MGGKLLANTVSSSAPGSTCSPSGSTAACTANVAILTPALTLTKTADTATTTPGGVVHYTVTVTNTGQTPYAAASFSDSLAACWTTPRTANDAAATSGGVSYSAPTLTWTGALAPGATATITYSVTVDKPDTGDKLLVNALTSTARGEQLPGGRSAIPAAGVRSASRLSRSPRRRT